MNDKPIEQSHDADLRKSQAALRRAAKRARELARSTGTRLVLGRHGKVLYVAPKQSRVAESPGAYGNKP